MPRETLTARPNLAMKILFIGVFIYCLLCCPAIVTRGYPKLDPFWQAMPFLWFVPVIISAMFDDDRPRRFRHLLMYSIFAAFIMSGVWYPSLTPRRILLSKIFVTLPYWVTINIGATLLIELVWQWILRHFRKLSAEKRTTQQSDIIEKPVNAREAESVAPVGVEIQESSCQPWRSTAIVCAVLLVAILFPFFFRTSAIKNAVTRGASVAMNEWQNGNAAIYVESFRFPALTQTQRPIDPFSGLTLRYRMAGVERMAWEDAYNAVIQKELESEDKQSLLQFVLTKEELQSLLSDASFVDVPGLPYRLGEKVELSVGPEGILVNGEPAFDDSPTIPVQYATLPKPSELLLLRSDDVLWTVHRNGTLLQCVYISEANRIVS